MTGVLTGERREDMWVKVVPSEKEKGFPREEQGTQIRPCDQLKINRSAFLAYIILYPICGFSFVKVMATFWGGLVLRSDTCGQERTKGNYKNLIGWYKAHGKNIHVDMHASFSHLKIYKHLHINV
ncbi:hypothetical protein BCR41DRAFT_367076 [Lobosporangium transversale]|uniref:Uncharacterized protein n=1 Tax=Lobosporangium transversale TaxID=64571 RepID=A0A1Y2H369_9FUNG|nr:hypothetical protein BCR41DRAFT_367076 [Lobosporangium transversale]ORZ28441.1 hypothetical protein BCR41DRAFT_367076 [Lobosporangium transversale]|eukprot:XP_021886126.1 hypothetical protein BCR41DRAFT_367076 [Lobosporangium transversale]